MHLMQHFWPLFNLNMVPNTSQCVALNSNFNQIPKLFVVQFIGASFSGFRHLCRNISNLARVPSSTLYWTIAWGCVMRIFASQFVSDVRSGSIFSKIVVKRWMDVAISSGALFILSPFLVVLSCIVMADGGDVFYSQKRVGRGGRIFPCWKFRTMVPNAEDKLTQILAHDPVLKKEFETYWKLRVDPRCTPIGRFLRRFSLDEMPQIWNVLIGDMSIVGPRPRSLNEMAFIRDTLPTHIDDYLAIRPGLTCLWQIRGRNKLGIIDKTKLDSYYSRHWSLRSDIMIILKTIPVVLKGEGAS